MSKSSIVARRKPALHMPDKKSAVLRRQHGDSKQISQVHQKQQEQPTPPNSAAFCKVFPWLCKPTPVTTATQQPTKHTTVKPTPSSQRPETPAPTASPDAPSQPAGNSGGGSSNSSEGSKAGGGDNYPPKTPVVSGSSTLVLPTSLSGDSPDGNGADSSVTGTAMSSGSTDGSSSSGGAGNGGGNSSEESAMFPTSLAINHGTGTLDGLGTATEAGKSNPSSSGDAVPGAVGATKSAHAGTIVGAVLGVLAFLSLLILFILLIRRRRRQRRVAPSAEFLQRFGNTTSFHTTGSMYTDNLDTRFSNTQSPFQPVSEKT